MGNKTSKTVSSNPIAQIHAIGPPLPLDIWKSVLYQLTEVEDVISVIKLCKTTHSFGDDDLLWKRLFEIYQPRFDYAHPKKWSSDIPFDYGGEFEMLRETSQKLVLDSKNQSWKNQFIFWYRQDLIKSLHQDDCIKIVQMSRGCFHQNQVNILYVGAKNRRIRYL